MCKVESLKDGSLDLADFAFMNELLTLKAENEWRAHKASEDEARRRQT